MHGSAAENVVPEPGSRLLLVTGAALAIRGRRRQMFATMLGLVIGVSYATRASADQFTLYANTQDTQTATGFGGTNNNVLIDDVLVPSSRNPSMRPLASHVIIGNARGLHRVLHAYVEYYLKARTHLSLDKDAPISRPIALPADGDIVAITHLGGLHHRYERRAT